MPSKEIPQSGTICDVYSVSILWEVMLWNSTDLGAWLSCTGIFTGFFFLIIFLEEEGAFLWKDEGYNGSWLCANGSLHLGLIANTGPGVCCCWPRSSLPWLRLRCILACVGWLKNRGLAKSHARAGVKRSRTPWKSICFHYGCSLAEFTVLLLGKLEWISLFLRSQTVLKCFMWANEQHYS